MYATKFSYIVYMVHGMVRCALVCTNFQFAVLNYSYGRTSTKFSTGLKERGTPYISWYVLNFYR